MTGLSETNNSIVFQNVHAQLEISKEDVSVQRVIDRVIGKNLRGEKTHFLL